MNISHRNFAVLNVALFFALALAWREGWVLPLFVGDTSHLTLAIAGWWAVGLAEVWRGKWERASGIADDLVFLGLLGTVIGFAQALAGITPERVSAGQSAEMVGQFVQGARTALYTTIVGSVGNYWLRLNDLLVRKG